MDKHWTAIVDIKCVTPEHVGEYSKTEPKVVEDIGHLVVRSESLLGLTQKVNDMLAVL